jgi:uncharacterized protein (TIGR00730 family)
MTTTPPSLDAPPPDEAHTPFPSAGADAKAARAVPDTPQTRSPSFRLAFTDQDFLLREELRPTRLQLELMKAEMTLREEHIVSTIVVFGSARVMAPEDASARLAEAERDETPQADAALGVARQAAAFSRYYEEARRFSRLASAAGQETEERRFVVVTGGGPGIMEAANRGAADVGARSIGFSVVLPREQWPNRYVTPQLCFQFHYFAVRKMHFLMRARALVCFPGGFGTMDELFETLTLIQTGRIAPIPVLLFGEAWWRRIIDFDAMVEEGVIAPADLGIFRFVETAEAAWDAIAAAYGWA